FCIFRSYHMHCSVFLFIDCSFGTFHVFHMVGFKDNFISFFIWLFLCIFHFLMNHPLMVLYGFTTIGWCVGYFISCGVISPFNGSYSSFHSFHMISIDFSFTPNRIGWILCFS